MNFNIVWMQRIIAVVEWVEYYRQRLEAAESEMQSVKERLKALEQGTTPPVEVAVKRPRGRPRKVVDAAKTADT